MSFIWKKENFIVLEWNFWNFWKSYIFNIFMGKKKPKSFFSRNIYIREFLEFWKNSKFGG